VVLFWPSFAPIHCWTVYRQSEVVGQIA